MKLSEAILLGSIGSEQGFGYRSGMKSGIKKCAIGAALLAIDKETDSLSVSQLTIEWPWVERILTNGELPIDVTSLIFPPKVLNLIWWLNDKVKWTRPQIAAWIATIEPEEGGIADNINLSTEANELQVLTPGLTSLGVSCQG